MNVTETVSEVTVEQRPEISEPWECSRHSAAKANTLGLE